MVELADNVMTMTMTMMMTITMFMTMTMTITITNKIYSTMVMLIDKIIIMRMIILWNLTR